MSKPLDAAVGIASGLAQGTTIVHAQIIVLIAVSLDVPPQTLAWVAPIGFLVPLIANGLTLFGDWVSTRAVCLWVAAITLVGVLLLAAGGIALARGRSDIALWLVAFGSIGVPAALRHGDLIVAHLTLRKDPDEQISLGRTVRAFLVVGIYLPALPAGLVVEAHGWPWVFGGYAVLNAAGFVLMARRLSPSSPVKGHGLRPYILHFLDQFRDGRLLVAAAAALLVRAVVLAWVTGMAVSMIGRGHAPGMVGLVAVGGLLAAPCVLWRPRGAQTGLALVAVAVPIGVTVVLATALFLPGSQDLGSGGMVWYLVLLAIASGLAEWAKQVGQLMTSYQATAGGTPTNRFRRLGVANLGGNVGAMLGATVGPLAAGYDERVWLLLLAGLAVTYGVAQGIWLVLTRR